jgi:hypothetical protein
MFKNHLIFLMIALLGACAPTIADFNDYQNRSLSKSAFMPSAEVVAGKPYKIVVFELDEKSNSVASQARLGSSLAVNVENVLTNNHLAQLIDRNAAPKLGKEIALAEMNKTGSYKGPQIADYAVSGSIGNASFTSKYSSAMVMANRDGTLVRIPPKFTYSANVDGNIKIYELPSMTVAENLEFSGKRTRTENVQSNGGVSVLGLVDFGGQNANAASRDDNLVRQAGEDAIDSVSYEIKNFFAKQGYILEKRALKSKTIFKINVGSADGINQGDKFQVIAKYANQNAITNVVETEKRIIATGKVTDKIDPNYSWIVIDNKKDVELIRLGDAVKFKYERSFINKALRAINKIMPN